VSRPSFVRQNEQRLLHRAASFSQSLILCLQQQTFAWTLSLVPSAHLHLHHQHVSSRRQASPSIVHEKAKFLRFRTDEIHKQSCHQHVECRRCISTTSQTIAHASIQNDCRLFHVCSIVKASTFESRQQHDAIETSPQQLSTRPSRKISQGETSPQHCSFDDTFVQDDSQIGLQNSSRQDPIDPQDYYSPSSQGSTRGIHHAVTRHSQETTTTASNHHHH
jgi:hypothetical protein